ncbi:hypothetical protein QBC32DRAFT_342052 [Pseudoneurospora amorphoporcata]|uniref:Uncharacterized protein n=1 Tax=Pseudoneurospora amorphoporcata TaxID=241081 RepID=A0AAN6NUL8_9PEZI|nr:hypothetical protein QBC32DRAFT_342052 [Pseudoneurospora amorphoporcata]
MNDKYRRSINTRDSGSPLPIGIFICAFLKVFFPNDLESSYHQQLLNNPPSNSSTTNPEIKMHGSTCPKCGAASDGSSKSCGSCGAVRYLSPFLCPTCLYLYPSTLDKSTNFTLPTIVLPQLSCVMTYL